MREVAEVKKAGRRATLLGILVIVLGVLAMCAPMIAGLSVGLVVGGLLALRRHDDQVQVDLLAAVRLTRQLFVVERAHLLLRDAHVGRDHVAQAEFPSMGSEDYSYYLEEVPGCFVRFGARHPDWEPIPLHSPAFDIDERVLGIGTRFFDSVARLAHARSGEFTDGV